MGILTNPSQQKTPASAKRKSASLDFSNLQPLKSSSTVKNFAGYRDANIAKHSVMRKLEKKKKGDDLDSDMDDDDDAEDEPAVKATAGDLEDDKEIDAKKLLSPEDAARQE